MNDLRFALRQLLKAPGFTATVVLTLALGIGACTVIFTVINSLLLHPMGDLDLARTVILHETQLPLRPQMQLSPPAFLELEREAKSFEFLSGWTSFTTNLSGGDMEPQRLGGMAVTARTLDSLGAWIALGRGFLPEEFTAGKNSVAIITFTLWQRAFGGARDVVGRSVLFDGRPTTIVGVLSEDFSRLGSENEVWAPLVFTDSQRLQQRGAHYLQVQGRLKAGVTLAQAQAELNVFAARWDQQYPETNKGYGLLVRELGAYLNRTLTPMLRILLGTVACVLLISCANVANLLLARATVRQKEISIRAALGAGRARLVRQLLVESILLAVLGGGAGVLLAQWGLHFIRSFAPSAGTDFARLAYVRLDPTMLGFTLVFSVTTGVLFGLAPAWLASHTDLNEALKQGGRSSTEGRGRGGLRNVIAALEIALAVVLLAGAGLLIRSFTQLAHVDPGFTPENAATMRIFLRPQKYQRPDQRMAFADALFARLRALPGVDSAAFTTLMPFNSPGLFQFSIAGRPPVASPANLPGGVAYDVTADYFRAMGIRLERGRTFTERDDNSAPHVVVINETLAKAYFPNEDPLGRQLVFGSGPGAAHEIVGIVADVMQGAPGQPPLPQLYLSWRQYSTTTLFAVVRTTGDPSAVLATLKSQVYAIDRDQPVSNVRSLANGLGDALARQRFMLNLLGAFAGIALAIAAVGLYGVMAYSVSLRTTEFGIRMALGASTADVLKQVLRQGMMIVAVGLATGLIATLALGRLVESLLYHTTSRDPLTLALIVAVLVTVAFVACLLPARRATKVDPMVALRAE